MTVQSQAIRPRIVVIGSFDTKASEYAFLCDTINSQGGESADCQYGRAGEHRVVSCRYRGGRGSRAAGGDSAALRSESRSRKGNGDDGRAGAAVVRRLHDEGRVAGIIGMGGSGGTSVITAAMRALPVGVPKVCVSTVAGGNTAPYVGLKDITLIPSIADVAGLNRISRIILTRAAGAIVGMVNATVADVDRRSADHRGQHVWQHDRVRRPMPRDARRGRLRSARVSCDRHRRPDDGSADRRRARRACLDITTTEWADTVCGGVFDAGEDRLSAAGRRGIPHLIVPGCIDMANFGPLETVPQKYRDAGRQLYSWNPSVTLMRTNVEENRRMGHVFAEKANAATGPVAFLIPLRGVSILDGDGQPFCDREADQAMFAALRENLRPGIPVVEVDANINDPAFADKAVEMMLHYDSDEEITTKTRKDTKYRINFECLASCPLCLCGS